MSIAAMKEPEPKRRRVSLDGLVEKGLTKMFSQNRLTAEQAATAVMPADIQSLSEDELRRAVHSFVQTRLQHRRGKTRLSAAYRADERDEAVHAKLNEQLQKSMMKYRTLNQVKYEFRNKDYSLYDMPVEGLAWGAEMFMARGRGAIARGTWLQDAKMLVQQDPQAETVGALPELLKLQLEKSSGKVWRNGE